MITVENCHAECDKGMSSENGDIYAKSASWSVIYNLCIQQGMNIHEDQHLSGLQKVVKFIIEIGPHRSAKIKNLS